ncbi:MAG: hypothetical protein ACE5IQ_06105 [Candidatus Methylomirabilales bacterium]
MKKVTVFILYDHPLFGLGLERLLKQQRGIEVLGATARGHNALEELRTHHPDVIMIEGGEGSLGPSLSEVLKESLPGRVISIDPGENRATVYTTRQVPAADVEDLVKVVRSVGRQERCTDRRTP